MVLGWRLMDKPICPAQVGMFTLCEILQPVSYRHLFYSFLGIFFNDQKIQNDDFVNLVPTRFDFYACEYMEKS